MEDVVQNLQDGHDFLKQQLDLATKYFRVFKTAGYTYV